MLDGHVFKAYLPGGASGGILPATLNNIPLDRQVPTFILNQQTVWLIDAMLTALIDPPVATE